MPILTKNMEIKLNGKIYVKSTFIQYTHINHRPTTEKMIFRNQNFV